MCGLSAELKPDGTRHRRSTYLPADPLRTHPGSRYPLYPAAPRLPPPSGRRSVRAGRRAVITILLRFTPALLPLLPATAVLIVLSHSRAAKGDDPHHNPRKHETGKERASKCVLDFPSCSPTVVRNLRTRVPEEPFQGTRERANERYVPDNRRDGVDSESTHAAF